MKKLIEIIIAALFIAMCGYLFISNISAVKYFASSTVDSYIKVESIARFALAVMGFSGLVTSVFTLFFVIIGRTKHASRRFASVATLLILAFFFADFSVSIYEIIKYNLSFADYVNDFGFARNLFILICGVIMSIGVNAKRKTPSVIITSIGAIGVIALDIAALSKKRFSLDMLKYSPETSHILIFIILGAILAAGYSIYSKLSADSEE